ncbi:MAG: hypothetical protein HY820_27920 [Acidobacteria bacterium]|nr:hypothetical protein [Acidobacteriota bacterium]
MVKKSELHFDDDTWLDVVRSIPTAANDELQQHLNSGCETCHAALRLWTGVRDSLPEALLEGPSEQAVRAVLKAFELQNKVPLLTRIAEAARLLFDSSFEPVPFGVRGGNRPARHLLHEAGGTLIDLRIEQETSGPACITGQIHAADSLNAGPHPPAIYLVQDGQRLIANTLCTGLGEFQMEFQQQGRLSIFVEMSASQIVGIQLPELLPSTNAWTT